jgi:hypothetical protein
MRRVFILTGLLAVILMATWGGPSMVSANTCTETCSGGAVLSCTSSTGMCNNAGGGSITCCGATLSCGPINTYDACRNNCDTAHDNCVNSCGTRAGSCLTNCNTGLRTCWTHCGAAPATSGSC